ncbi:hypothetical protein TSUD_377580 [Trifolium subterraneum]|uniref:START domain-containing protein n=1 Tax=Trifolium subterraneum TaxID=3900 RepID=A0A2Z6MDA8_TRISU|nr:hypothetical protein TSUD_377580 [Trifolium subterraneum]
MKEALKATKCEPCGGPPFPMEEHEHYKHKMQQENDELRKEYEEKSKLLTNFMERKISRPMFEHALNSIQPISRNNELENPPTVHGSSSHVHGLSNRESMSVNRSTQNHDEEKGIISQHAILAMQELVRLVITNEPFWINISNNHQDGRYTLDHESYYQVFPKNNHIRGDTVFEESSKYSGIVGFDGMKLVEMFLDSINEEMHILSPLVRPRKFNIIRYCKQVDAGVWVITDVSFDSSRPNTPPLTRSWKHPSGCMIREMHNKSCMVTWVEHVEVEDMLHTHHIFRDFVGNYTLYGAESWIKEFQRMCDKSFSFYAETIPAEESIGVIQTIKGRRSVMRLAHRMVKNFCECLTMAGQLEFQQLNHESSIGRWDLMACENPMYEIGHISNGLHPGSYVVFAPIDTSSIIAAIRDEDSISSGFVVCSYAQPNASFEAFNNIGSSSSGGVGRVGAGTLLTLATQILTYSPNGIDQHQNMEVVATINTLLSTSVLKVRGALLNYSN